MRTHLRYALACAVVSAFVAFPALSVEGNPKSPPPERKAAAAAPETQQEKMKRCNATAKEKALKGDERRAYMSSCLKG